MRCVLRIAAIGVYSSVRWVGIAVIMCFVTMSYRRCIITKLCIRYA